MPLKALCQVVESGNTSEAENLARKLLEEGHDTWVRGTYVEEDCEPKVKHRLHD